MGFRLQFMTMRRETSGGLKLADLQAKMSMIKHIRENLSEQERSSFLQDSYQNLGDEVDFELFLRVNPQTKILIICIYLLHVCVFRAWFFFFFLTRLMESVLRMFMEMSTHKSIFVCFIEFQENESFSSKPGFKL